MYIVYIYVIIIYICMQVGPHKAVAEVSRIGNTEHIGER